MMNKLSYLEYMLDFYLEMADDSRRRAYKARYGMSNAFFRDEKEYMKKAMETEQEIDKLLK